MNNRFRRRLKRMLFFATYNAGTDGTCAYNHVWRVLYTECMAYNKYMQSLYCPPTEGNTSCPGPTGAPKNAAK